MLTKVLGNAISTKLSRPKPTLRFPAEWEHHRATWIGWPHKASDWPGKLQSIEWVYVEIARALCLGEQVCILVQNATHEKRARKYLTQSKVSLKNIRFFRWPSDRGWLRDSFPFFVHPSAGTKPQAVHFKFNAWAKYKDWKKDVLMPSRVSKARRLKSLVAEHRGKEVVLEGGAVDTNGQGVLLTTEECLLHKRTQVRNKGFSKEDYEEVFRKFLGIEQVIWLGNGIAGDDTHGHVDDLCRFVNESTVVLAQEKNEKDINFRPLRENWERLRGVRLPRGQRLDVIALPMPQARYFESDRLPMSYANFYIANDTVIVPTFNDPADREALGILAELFPQRRVCGIHAVDLVLGFGTLHCLTHEEP